MMTGLSVDDLLASDLSLELAVDELRYRWTMQTSSGHHRRGTVRSHPHHVAGVGEKRPASLEDRTSHTSARPGVPAPSATNVISFSQFKDMIGRE